MKPKKKFKKPEIKKVPLKVEEAVLAGCKAASMATGPGGFMGVCVNSLGMGQTQDCSAMGS